MTFEKSTAAKTALLLSETQLGPNLVQVSGNSTSDVTSPADHATSSGDHMDDIAQEDKPRTRIIAEYLAHGYTISDNVISRAIDVDKSHGYSTRFTELFKSVDDKTGATATAKNIDAKYGIMEKSAQVWNTLGSFCGKALDSQPGQKLVDLYHHGEKSVTDVHNEARRLADLKAQQDTAGKSKDLHSVPGTEGKRTECEPK